MNYQIEISLCALNEEHKLVEFFNRLKPIIENSMGFEFSFKEGNEYFTLETSNKERFESFGGVEFNKFFESILEIYKDIDCHISEINCHISYCLYDSYDDSHR